MNSLHVGPILLYNTSILRLL